MINFDRQQTAMLEDEIQLTINGSVRASLVKALPEGMDVETASPLRPGTRCTINVPTAGDELRLRGRVYRCRMSWTSKGEEGQKPSPSYVATIEFVDISKIELEVLMLTLGKGSVEASPEPEASWLRRITNWRPKRV